MRVKGIIGSIAAVVLSQAIGCQQEVGSSAPAKVENVDQTSGTLLSSVRFSDTHAIDIYEFAPGDVAVNERGAHGDERILDEKTIASAAAAEIYEAITKGRPELRKEGELAALKLADVRADARKTEMLALPSEQDALASMAPQASGSNSSWDPFWDNWFTTNFCGTTGTPTPGQIHSGPDGWCLLHWNGDASWSTPGARSNFYSAVDNWDSVQMQHLGYTWSCPLFSSCSWSQSWHHWINPGNWEQWGWANGASRKARAIGNAFQFGGKWTTNCGLPGNPCCAGGVCAPGLTCVGPWCN